MKKVYKAVILFVSIIILLFLVYSFFTDQPGGDFNDRKIDTTVSIENDDVKKSASIGNINIDEKDQEEHLDILQEDNSVTIDNQGDVKAFIQKFFGDLDKRAYNNIDLHFYEIGYLDGVLSNSKGMGLVKYVERLFSANLAYLKHAKDEKWKVQHIVCDVKDLNVGRNFKIFYADSNQMFLIHAAEELPRIIKGTEKKTIYVLPLKNFVTKTQKSMSIFYDWDLNNITDDELQSKILFANIFVLKGNAYDIEIDANKLLDLYPVRYRKTLSTDQDNEVIFDRFNFVIYQTYNDNQLYFYIKR